MSRAPILVVFCVAVVLASTRPAEPADPPAQATPQRPSLSFNTQTTHALRFEIEVGGALSDGTDSLPVFLKYGLTDRVELEAGFDAVRRVDLGSDVVMSQGDLVLGARARVRERERDVGPSAAIAGWFKAPTAQDGAGSEEFDFGAIGIVSLTLERYALDLNLGLSGLGQPGDSLLGQVQGIGTLSFPARAGWTPYVELALQHTAGIGGGGFVDAGVSHAPSPRMVVDFAAGGGWSEGYPDFWVTLGWTFLTGRER